MERQGGPLLAPGHFPDHVRKDPLRRGGQGMPGLNLYCLSVEKSSGFFEQDLCLDHSNITNSYYASTVYYMLCIHNLI